jgi:hypothetical protein
MNFFSPITGKIIAVTSSFIVLVALHFPPLMQYLVPPPPISIPTKTYSVPTVHVQNTISVSTTTQSIIPKTLPSVDTSVISSSMTTIGAFIIVVTCKDKNPFRIDVLKNGLTTQTLGISAGDSGVGDCPSAGIQDINFDGYPDFMVLDDTGSGGAAYAYWLYSTSTQQFYCSQPYGACGLMNPTFDPSSKIITSTDYTSAGTDDVETYGVNNGNLILIKDIQNNL